MELLLSDSEHIIKNWDYSEGSSNSQSTKSSLMVTNKRIISMHASSTTLSYKEIPLEYVKTIYCHREAQSNSEAKSKIASGIVLIVLAVVLAILSIVLKIESVAIIGFILPAVFFFAGGIALIFIGMRLLNQGSFFLKITTVGAEGTSLILGSRTRYGNKNTDPDMENQFAVKLNREAVEDICSSLGSIVFNYKNKNV